MGRKSRGEPGAAKADAVAEEAAEGASFPIPSQQEQDAQREREGRVVHACLTRQLAALRVEAVPPAVRAMDAFTETLRGVEAVVGPVPRPDAVERTGEEPCGFPHPLRHVRESNRPAAGTGWIESGGHVSAYDVIRLRALLKVATAAAERQGCPTPVLRPHHVQGVAWLLKLYGSSAAAILNDERGAGKAVQVRRLARLAPSLFTALPLRLQVACMLAMLGRVKRARGLRLHPHLVVTTAAHVSLWDRELVRWAPELAVHVASRSRFLPRAADVVLLCADDDRHAEALRARMWDVLVVDNTAGAVHRPAEMTCLPQGLGCQFRVLMGAGLPSRLTPLCRLLSLLHPALSPLAGNFAACCAAGQDSIAAGAVAVLRTALLPLVLARPAAAAHAPSLVAPAARCEHTLHFVALGAAQRKVHAQVCAVGDEVARGGVAAGSVDRVRLTATAVTQRAAVLHPRLLPGRWDGAQGRVPAAKVQALVGLLRGDRHEGRKGVVFCQVGGGCVRGQLDSGGAVS